MKSKLKGVLAQELPEDEMKRLYKMLGFEVESPSDVSKKPRKKRKSLFCFRTT